MIRKISSFLPSGYSAAFMNFFHFLCNCCSLKNHRPITSFACSGTALGSAALLAAVLLLQ